MNATLFESLSCAPRSREMAADPAIARELARLRMPTTVRVIDFETECDCSLKRVSGWEYVKNPSFRILGCAVAESGSVSWMQDGVPPHDDGITYVCHNAKFDLLILQEKFHICPMHFIDTMDLVRQHGLSPGAGLAAAAEYYAVGHKLAPAKEDTAVYAMNDAEITYRLLARLLPTISREEIRLSEHTIRMYLTPLMRFDSQRADALVAGWENAMERACAVAGKRMDEVTSDTKYHAAMRAILDDERFFKPVKGGGEKVRDAKADVDTRKLLMGHSNICVRSLVAARQITDSLPLHIARVNAARRMAAAAGATAVTGGPAWATAEGGAVPVNLVYYGAHTGRFSGKDGNLQNLPRTGEGAEVGSIFVPPPGYSLVSADFAQIEVRVLALCAGQDDLLAGLRDGSDVYSDFGTYLFQRPVRRSRADDAPDAAAKLDADRQVAKRIILGAGYGMSGDGFAAKFGYDVAFGNKVIAVYRERYRKIEHLWWALLRTATTAVARGSAQLGALRMAYRNGHLGIRLPSGRWMMYPKTTLEGHRLWYTDGRTHTRTKITHRMLVENVCQGIARDLLRDAILRLSDAWFTVVRHVHDSVDVLTPTKNLDLTIAEVRRIMLEDVPWIPGLPLAVEVAAKEHF